MLRANITHSLGLISLVARQCQVDVSVSSQRHTEAGANEIFDNLTGNMNTII